MKSTAVCLLLSLWICLAIRPVFAQDVSTSNERQIESGENPVTKSSSDAGAATSCGDNSFWKDRLTPEQFHVTREGGTERPFTGKYYNHHEPGTYYCSNCGAPLFSSETKFESGSGWPSFYQSLDPKAIKTVEDNAHGMRRTEILCARCGAHLGHVFDDGPRPTGLRYCVNSLSLEHHPPGVAPEKTMPSSAAAPSNIGQANTGQSSSEQSAEQKR
jgi:peptide-methionine (R)-S-oxide reductase